MDKDALKCPLCGQKDVVFFTTSRDYQSRQDDTEYNAYQCRDCNIVFQCPFPSKEEFDQIYPDDYYAHAETDHIPFLTRLLNSFLQGKGKFFSPFKRSLYPYLEEIKKSQRVLDIGCGKGLYLDVLKSNGKETYGLEPDANAVKILKKKGHQATQGSISDSKFEDNYFDMVTMFQVFEHLEHPSDELSEIYRILKPGGVFVFETPNIDSDLAKNKNFWRSLELPRHLILHSSKSIRKLLQQEGFQAEVLTRVSPTDIKETFFLKKNLTNTGSIKLYSRLMLPYILFQYLFNHKKGSLLIAIAKKK